MRTVRRWAAILATSAAVAGCGATSGTTHAPVNRNVITVQEMADYANAFTAVQSLRPLWLRGRGSASIRRSETIKVYLDGSLLGGTENLKQITVLSISTIQFLDGLEASNRWGLDHGNGAILVTSRKR